MRPFVDPNGVAVPTRAERVEQDRLASVLQCDRHIWSFHNRMIAAWRDMDNDQVEVFRAARDAELEYRHLLVHPELWPRRDDADPPYAV